MKKTLLVVAVVAALIGATYFLDRATRKGSAREVKAASAATATPVMSLKDLHGNDVSLADYRGKVVLVNFWATWCEPCRIEIPWLIEFQKKYGPRGFTVLGVAMDDEGNDNEASYRENDSSADQYGTQAHELLRDDAK